LLVALASALGLFPIVPMLWVIFTALKDRTRVLANPLAPPSEAHWENFVTAWEVGRFGRYIGNSIVVAIPTVAAILLFGLLAAFAFAYLRFRGRRTLLGLFLFGLNIPLGVLIIPLFYEMRDLRLLNTPWALILPQVAKQLPFAIFLLYIFIRELPQEILDAGLIDGCSRWDLLWRVVAPLSWPALLTQLVFNFMWTWNQFLLPTILIQQDSARTLPVGLAHFQGRYVTDVPLLMAGATITFLPVVVIYVIFQRQFIRGIAAGAFR
jgi:raffinose/stachyose/melibiose transport system permease protein